MYFSFFCCSIAAYCKRSSITGLQGIVLEHTATLYRPGHILEGSCATGYTSSGRVYLECTRNSTWQTHGMCAGCSLTDLRQQKMIPKYARGIGIANRYYIVECIAGYEFDRRTAFGAVAIALCHADGRWTLTSATCRIVTCNASRLISGLGKLSLTTSTTPVNTGRDAAIQYGVTVQVSCHFGFASSRDRESPYVGFRCSAVGTWEQLAVCSRKLPLHYRSSCTFILSFYFSFL